MRKPSEPSDAIELYSKSTGESVLAYVQFFNGKTYLHIREFYNTADGDMRPSKKGIALPINIAVEHIESLRSLVLQYAE
jgi:hypothetical protein